MATVVVDEVRKTYVDTVALDGVSLTIHQGEVFSLLGPNGAGKTTLVRCLTGTTKPDTGHVELLNQDPTITPKDRIGLVPQDFTPPERLTPRELFEYYAGLYAEPRAVDTVLSDVGLAEIPDTQYRHLSGG
ncbi:MAG: ATP-binding cassette domain-containing protein, partial [Halobacteriaceae archaeon]